MDPTVKLLTLINVSAARPGKRQKSSHHTHYDKITRKAANAAAEAGPSTEKVAAHPAPSQETDKDRLVGQEDSDDEQEQSIAADAFDAHFGNAGSHLQAAQAELQWSTERTPAGPLGTLIASRTSAPAATGNPQSTVLDAFQKHAAEKHGGVTPLHKAIVRQLAGYADLAHSNVNLQNRTQVREATAMHVMSHVAKTRRRIIKNNEKLAKLASEEGDVSLELRDQGFTRPKVLVLLPFRNSAVEWVEHLAAFSLCTQFDNKKRFDSEFGLPEGAVDKLAEPAAAARYPPDHIATFKGNIDDSFKFGIKVTRKSFKMFSQFYDSDVIVASPLGLRLSIEKDRDSDFLSSIEVLVADQMDVMAMQNWEHLQFVLERLNQIPKQAHQTDFSRVKQWYLDGQAARFRQTVMLSSYEFAEMRAVYSKALTNVAGKARTTSTTAGGSIAQVRQGIRQTFIRFDAANLHSEPDLRFAHFTTKTLPMLLKSAVSASHTLIFVPSYFDFVRIDAHLRGMKNMRYAALSEYSSPREIARAREAFFSGKKDFMLMTERFHFYRRYKVRGAKTVVFYDLPEHSEFFSEVAEFPFVAKDGEAQDEADLSEVTLHAVFSKYDLIKLARIVGDKEARRMVEEVKATWRFV